MKTDLDLLIDHYKEEEKQLEALVQESLEEFDYKRAHRNQQALIMVRQQLKIFYQFKYPDKDKRETIERRMDELQSLAVRNHDGWGNELIAEYDQEVDQLLEQLYQLRPNRLEDTQEIDDAIFELLEGRINGFKLHLNRNQNLYLAFSFFSENLLSIAFTPAAQLPDYANLYTAYTSKKLQNIGFELTADEQQSVYKQDVRQLRDATGIKMVLAKVLYDVFENRSFKNVFLERY